MAVSTRSVDFGLKVETNLYLKGVRQMGNSLIHASTQRIDFGLMAVSQRTTMPRVIVEQ